MSTWVWFKVLASDQMLKGTRMTSVEAGRGQSAEPGVSGQFGVGIVVQRLGGHHDLMGVSK